MLLTFPGLHISTLSYRRNLLLIIIGRGQQGNGAARLYLYTLSLYSRDVSLALAPAYAWRFDIVGKEREASKDISTSSKDPSVCCE